MATAAGGEGDAEAAALARFRSMVPQLGGGNYKGSHGKVAVVGGCAEFTGAPFFAAMSALRVGADMAYVICTPSAAVPIKSYSPELMVLPYLPEGPPGEEQPAVQAEVDAAVTRILPWLGRASALLVGPGLGSDPSACAAAAGLLCVARRRGLPAVVDGSALTHIVAKDASLVCGYRSCVLTPNVAELGRIAGAVGLPLPGRMSDEWLQHAPSVAAAFGGPLLLAKGEVDLVCGPGPNPDPSSGSGSASGAPSDSAPPRPLLRCSVPGSLRRCGGQGDVLAGTVAAFLGWAAKQRPLPHEDGGGAGGGGGGGPPGLDTAALAACAYAGCAVMRGAAAAAFAAGERSMVAGDIIPHLYPTFKRVAGCR
ncbi:hypothetical protein GPECTOR_108g173 [Gonium pectorale]|uniref:ATP-dependent (S)-NAD(P)H-hydrate dehydratase n=1 Tax=Gonium pectorale TaxID=33097 RepID=A0A150FZG8_GONPE|nr:hypothetical protein GPECTOR_108g173 [Gonium pectorale]|eukprot:KXZ42978.1 hypothetical protein GPECTOR_108g173 [Gonium pectorale]